MKKLFAFLLALALALATLTVPALAEDAPKAGKAKTVITLSHSGTVTLNKGDTLQLTATVTPNKKVTWKSSSKKIATVSKTGLVTAKKTGTATITAKAGKKTAKVKIKVVDPYKPTGVSISQGKSAKLNLGGTLQLGAVLKPSTARATLKWKSSKTKVATVDGNGVVTAKAEGKAKITVTAGKKKATITITVVNPNKPTGISLNRSGTVKLPMNETLTLTATLQPSTAVGNVTWKTSNKKVATVNGGVVTPKKKGTVTITAKVGKKSAKVKIKVVSASEHQHAWEPIYTTNTVVDTPAWDETVVDTPAWDETVVDTPATTQTVNHPEEGHYEQVEHKAEGHYETKTVTDKEAWVEQVPVYKDRWVVTQEAWTEKTKLVEGVKCYCGKMFKTYDEWDAHSQRNIQVSNYYNGFWDATPEAKKAIEDAYGNPPKGDGDYHGRHDGYSICSYEVDLDPSEWIEHPEEGVWENYFTGEYETVQHPAETHEENVWVEDKAGWTENKWVVDKKAWTETVNIPAKTHVVHHDPVTHVVHHDAVTHTEQVVTGHKCSTCGATK